MTESTVAVSFLVGIGPADDAGCLMGTAFLIETDDRENWRVLGEAPIAIDPQTTPLPDAYLIAIVAPAFLLRGE